MKEKLTMIASSCKWLLVLILCVSTFAHAQFLPANKTKPLPLTQSVLARWFETNTTIRDYQHAIDEMLPTDAEATAFDKLSIVEQDNIVNNYLQRKGLFEPLNTNIKKLGWTGVADYMRVSSQIGNAIAADLQATRIAQLTPEQARAVLDKTDPAVKAVSNEDLAFVRANMAAIRQHIQGYSASK